MAPAWTTDKSLLNPRFESYQLATGDLVSSTVRLKDHSPPLGRVLQVSTVSASLPPTHAEEPTLGWREAKFRASFNHLFPVNEGLAWIDAAGGIWKAHAADLEVKRLGQVPQPKAAAADHPPHGHYPTIQALSRRPQIWIISDGWGTLHQFDSASSTFLASAALHPSWASTSSPMPFNLHLALEMSESSSIITVLLSFATPKESARKSDRVRLACAQVNTSSSTLDIQYELQGDQYPAFVSLQEDSRAIFVSGAPFCSTTEQSLEPPAQPVEEDVPQDTKDPVEKPAQPSFSWTQDEESVVLSFPWPEALKNDPPQDLKVIFTPQFLNIHAPTARQMTLSHRKLWGLIDTHTSTWSLDPDRLTISLEKRHQGTTWPTVFDDSITDTSQNPPQEFSPEQLEAMKHVLSHMTSEEHLDEAEDPNPSTTLLGDGADRDDLASNTEERVRKQSMSLEVQTVSDATDPFELLSTPLPVAGLPSSARDSVVVKRQVDGLLLDKRWNHVATYPALDYILASKRSLNLRFILHHKQKFCIAVDASGSIFAYHGPAEPKALKATQAVLQVGRISEIVGAGLIPGKGLILLSQGALVSVSGLPDA